MPYRSVNTSKSIKSARFLGCERCFPWDDVPMRTRLPELVDLESFLPERVPLELVVETAPWVRC